MGKGKIMKVTVSRIRYYKDGMSKDIHTPYGIFRIKLDLQNLKFEILNPVNYVAGHGSASSLAMLKKRAKEELARITKVDFSKEERPARKGKRIGGLPTRST
jgi:hypothetical protein